MITCTLMDKADKNRWLPFLFDLYYQNMHRIAPSSVPYEQERSVWLSEVSPAVDKAPRQILLGLENDHLIGYIQYYTRDNLLMIEEFQISPSYQNTLLFHRMCRYLACLFPKNLERIEAYADIRNSNSRNLMKKLGFQEITESSDSEFIHLRADFANIKNRFIKNK